MDPELTIVLLGNTGVGKSAAGNTILKQRGAFESKFSLSPVTTTISEKTKKVFEKTITVIDTPGILESEQQTKNRCQELLQSSKTVLFLIVIRIDRFTKQEVDAIEAAIRILGDEGVNNSYLLFTGGDDLGIPLQRYIDKSKLSSLQNFVNRFGNRHNLFNNLSEDESQVRELLEKSACLRRNELPELEQHEALTIVLLGNTGVGKSAAGNTILGRAEFESRLSLKPLTTQISEKKGRVFGKLITVIDTPGILQSEKQIETCCLMLPLSSRPHLFLVVVRLGRFYREDIEAVQAAIRVLGPRRFESSYLLFTGGDSVKESSLEDLISEDDSVSKFVQKFSRRFHLFNNQDGGREQVKELLQKSAGDLVRSVRLVERTILLVGLSGSGKSSAGNTILGSEEFQTGSGFQTVTTEEKSAEVEDHLVTVIDTPGFEHNIDEQIYECLMRVKENSNPGSYTVVFVVRIDRMTEDESLLINLLSSIFYREGPERLMVLFTHGDKLRDWSIEEMVQSNSVVSVLVSRCGERYCVFDNKQKENRLQVRKFLNGGKHYHVEVCYIESFALFLFYSFVFLLFYFFYLS